MNNLEDLRKFVDHRPLLLGVATVLLSDNEIHLLLLKPSDNESWELPGGAAEPGEMVNGITKVEIFEDTSLEIDAGTFSTNSLAQNSLKDMLSPLSLPTV